MFNPLVDSFSKLTDTQIEEKIIELGKKYWQADKNPSLQSQIGTVLEMYKQEIELRRARDYQKQKDNSDDNDLDSLINID
jgi:adenylate kinase